MYNQLISLLLSGVDRKSDAGFRLKNKSSFLYYIGNLIVSQIVDHKISRLDHQKSVNCKKMLTIFFVEIDNMKIL